MSTSEVLRFPSWTPQSFAQLMREPRAVPVTKIRGMLSFPADRPERVPLVVMAIGSRGLTSGREEMYTQAFVSAGFAVLLVDGNTPRGVGETASNQGLLPWPACVADVLAAFAHVRDDPRIDGRRVALFGYSRGGFVATVANDERLQAAVLGAGPRFAAHVALYPPCYYRWRRPQPTSAPLLMILGGLDDLAPAPQGEAYAEALRAAGGHVEIVTFPQAHHSFDTNTPAMQSESNDNLSVRTILIEDDGEMVETATGIRAGNDWPAFLAALAAAPGALRRGTSGSGPLPRDAAVPPIVSFLRAHL